MEKKQIGKIPHYFDKISVAVIELKAPLKVGDTITIEGHGNSFDQNITSMQIDNKPIKEAKKGQSIGLKVAQPVKQKDLVFK